jgi:hypothetical protein
MPFGVLNLVMLGGLAAMAIPIIIHLLNRRRFNVVDWGAMQFLKLSETTRKRLLIEELLLLLLRMGLIGILVLALAGPYIESSALGKLGRNNRDIVLIFDGSYSMGYTGTGESAHAAAKEWASSFIEDLSAQDAVAILQAKQQVVPVQSTLTHDVDRVREAIRELPEPAGGCNWPRAIQAARKILESSQRTEREIIVLSDNQRFGWADPSTLTSWELSKNQLADSKAIKPRVWVVNLAPNRPSDPPNWSLASIKASQTVVPVGWEIAFDTALVLHGQQTYSPPHRLRLEVDGTFVRELKAPEKADLEKGQVPVSFRHAFNVPGSHLVSVIVEPDPPPDKQPPGYVIKDHLQGDNRQDFAVEIVPALPVLLVDGDERVNAKRRGVDYLRDALAPASDPNPIVRARVVPVQNFDPTLLTRDMTDKPGSKPRVLVLSNVARLSTLQQEAIASFLASGGGVLVTLGDRVEPTFFNDELYRDGQGWLPARLDDLVGDEAKPEHATIPRVTSFNNPALEMFRKMPTEGLADVHFPRWWKVSTPVRSSASIPVALFTSGDPFLVERTYQGGRVLLCTVPLDNSWRTDLTSKPAFVPLAHELIYYLAGARGAEHNVQPGQPLHYWIETEEELPDLSLQPPGSEIRKVSLDETTESDGYPVQVRRLPRGTFVEYEGTRETGVYRIYSGEKTIYYVAQPDPRESDLTPCNDADRAKVGKFIDVTYESDREQMFAHLLESAPRKEVWSWCLIGVVALLCGEVWMTRRLVRNQA